MRLKRWHIIKLNIKELGIRIFLEAVRIRLRLDGRSLSTKVHKHEILKGGPLVRHEQGTEKVFLEPKTKLSKAHPKQRETLPALY